MNIQIFKDYDEMSRELAALIAAQVRLFPDSVLGLATGSTPIGCYRELVRMHREENLDFSSVTTVNLDEYVGLPGSHDQSYRYFMDQNLFKLVNIDEDSINLPNGMAEDPEEEADSYEMLIDAFGGTDIQILGLGKNGHIGFNEPCDEFVGPTHVVELTESTINANARFFESADEVPRRAITMGMSQIMKSRRIIMAVCGADKAEALEKAVTGPIKPSMPASILQLHPDVTILADEAAMAWLSR